MATEALLCKAEFGANKTKFDRKPAVK